MVRKLWMLVPIEDLCAGLAFIYFMKSDIFVWNCQGAGNLNFHRFLKEYLRGFDLDILLLVETEGQWAAS